MESQVNLHPCALALTLVGWFGVPFSSAQAETLLNAQIVTAKGYAADAQDTPQAVAQLVQRSNADHALMLGVAGRAGRCRRVR